MVVTRAFVWASLIIGTVVRALPLFDPHGRALRQFASEDGYLMLTIARNLAIGNGLSVENGLTLTNGTQPLMTFVYAAVFWLVGGDKVWGVVLVQALGIAIGLVGAWLLYKVGLRLLHGRRNASSLAAIAAAAWYVAPIGARYTQNCLETGAAAVLPMGVGLLFLRSSPGPNQNWSIPRCLALGGLLGVAFLVRNDTVLLSGAVCLTLLLSGLRGGAVSFGRRILEAGTVGTTALVIASPWLAFNYIAFGHLVPVSGISQGANIPLGYNLSQVPSILAEQVSIVALIPGSWETTSVFLFLALALVLAWSAGAYWCIKEMDSVQTQWMSAWSVWAMLVVAFYGLIYGAGYFLGRYLYPLSPWMALLTVTMLHRLWITVGSPSPRLAQAAALSLILAMSLGLDVRVHRRGMNNGHFQAVDWIEQNVPDDVWIAAVQTGTIGFFHDRAYNLDGKVSPAALEARLEDRIFDYVLERPIAYLIDWTGIASWVEDERMAPHFDLLVLDEEQNLAVLHRTTAFEAAPP
jgi:hypothetical protein